MLSAGRLRHRLTIQRPVDGQDQNTGAPVRTWADVATVWADIKAVRANEFIAAQVEDSKVIANVTVRYRTDFDHSCRFYHQAKDAYYNIEGILPDPDSGLEFLVCPVSEGLRYTQGNEVIPDILEYPQISGAPEDGQVLTASNGVWANEPTGYAYQWYLNDLPVTGATAQTWLVVASLNDIVTVGVVASNAAGDSEEAVSDGVLITA